MTSKQPAGRSRAPWIIAGVAVLFLVLLGVGFAPRLLRNRQLASAASVVKSSLPEVTVMTVQRAKGDVDMTLPGNIQPVTEAVVFARADGYVRQRSADIGDHVRAGQLLAVIESPEVDQQLQQARAQLLQAQSALGQSEAAVAQAKANSNLAQVTTGRWQRLVDKGVLAQQDGDEKRSAYQARQADLQAAEANVRAARNTITANEANVQRLVDLQGFQKVKAPFAGVVTARGIDVGALVSAGSSSSTRELFHIAQIDRLRIFVNVPQSEVAYVRVGQTVQVFVQELGEAPFPARVVRTANSLEANSRTLLTEVQLPNADGKLLPGMYAQVKFVVHRDHPPVVIPGNALVSTESGQEVVLLRPDRTVHFQKLKLGRDYGAQMEVLAGLEPGARIVTNPNDSVREGQPVKVVSETSKAP